MEVKKSEVDITDLSEVRWRDNLKLVLAITQCLILVPKKEKRHGSSDGKWNGENSQKVVSNSDRLMFMNISANPVLQVYIPTSHYKDEEVKPIHDELEEI